MNENEASQKKYSLTNIANMMEQLLKTFDVIVLYVLLDRVNVL